MANVITKFVLHLTVTLVIVACLPSTQVHAASAQPAWETAPLPGATLFGSLEGIKNWLVANVMATFSYRERMIQMMAVGLFIGLVVMLRKMPGQT